MRPLILIIAMIIRIPLFGIDKKDMLKNDLLHFQHLIKIEYLIQKYICNELRKVKKVLTNQLKSRTKNTKNVVFKSDCLFIR